MNRSVEILDYLTRQDGPAEVILAPNAPPVTRVASGVELALNVVLDPGDVTDTLMALRARTSQPESAMPPSGSFSFGVPEVGRFRVSYLTQRGSKAFRVIRVPFRVPSPSEACEDADCMRRLTDAILSRQPGILAITGTSVIANSKLAYSLLRVANEKIRTVVFVVERSLTFLIAHGNSLVVQCELGNDVPTLEAGIRSAFLLEPDILFVGDIWPGDEMPSLTRAVEAGVFTLLSSVAMSGEEMLGRFHARGSDVSRLGPNELRAAAQVIPAAAGKIAVRLSGRLPT